MTVVLFTLLLLLQLSRPARRQTPSAGLAVTEDPLALTEELHPVCWVAPASPQPQLVDLQARHLETTHCIGHNLPRYSALIGPKLLCTNMWNQSVKVFMSRVLVIWTNNISNTTALVIWTNNISNTTVLVIWTNNISNTTVLVIWTNYNSITSTANTTFLFPVFFLTECSAHCSSLLTTMYYHSLKHHKAKYQD